MRPIVEIRNRRVASVNGRYPTDESIIVIVAVVCAELQPDVIAADAPRFARPAQLLGVERAFGADLKRLVRRAWVLAPHQLRVAHALGLKGGHPPGALAKGQLSANLAFQLVEVFVLLGCDGHALGRFRRQCVAGLVPPRVEVKPPLLRVELCAHLLGGPGIVHDVLEVPSLAFGS